MSTHEKLSALREDYLRDRAAEYERILGLTESPIEALLVADVLSRGAFQSNGEGSYLDDSRFDGVSDWRASLVLPDELIVWLVQPVITIGTGRTGIIRHRVDFAVIVRGEHRKTAGHVRFVIECDGHDFHEKTKEQARSDKSRDRALQSAGWRVLRFTGSEVYADAGRCASEAELAAWRAIVSESERRRPA